MTTADRARGFIASSCHGEDEGPERRPANDRRDKRAAGRPDTRRCAQLRAGPGGGSLPAADAGRGGRVSRSRSCGQGHAPPSPSGAGPPGWRARPPAVGAARACTPHLGASGAAPPGCPGSGAWAAGVDHQRLGNRNCRLGGGQTLWDVWFVVHAVFLSQDVREKLFFFFYRCSNQACFLKHSVAHPRSVWVRLSLASSLGFVCRVEAGD